MFIFKLKSDDDLRVEKGDNMRRDEKKKRKGKIILHTNKNQHNTYTNIKLYKNMNIL